MTGKEEWNDYFSGNRLYGDDFTDDEIAGWFQDESEAYAELVKNIYHHEKEGYSWHGLNRYYGYPHVDLQKIRRILGFGSATGAEFIPLFSKMNKSQISEVIILEPSESFVHQSICDVPIRYVKPNMNGILDFPDDSFDLITCFGVLHHIPNVSDVMKELSRCLAPGGRLLIREPAISMGDWRQPRAGLTTHERGIPIKIFREIIKDTNLKIVSENLCACPLTEKFLHPFFKNGVYNSSRAAFFDYVLCRFLKFNMRYHAVSPLQKIRPTCVYYVLTK